MTNKNGNNDRKNNEQYQREYLHQCSFLSRNEVDHVKWYTHHGRQSEQQSYEVAPPRVVIFQISQRRKLGQVKYEHAL